MAMLALRLGCLQTLCFLYHARSLMYSDTATSWVIILIAHLILHFFASLRQECIVFIISLGSLSSRVNNMHMATISEPCNGRDSHSDSSVRAGSAASASQATIIAICMSNVLAVLFPYYIVILHPVLLLKFLNTYVYIIIILIGRDLFNFFKAERC